MKIGTPGGNPVTAFIDIDNAPVESFFSSLKNKLVRHRQLVNQVEARDANAEYVECFYNRQRLHQALGDRSPEEFEKVAGESSSRCPLFPGHLSACTQTRGLD